MDILIIASLEGWMKTYLYHLKDGFEKHHVNVSFVNYRDLDKNLLSMLGGDKIKFNQRNNRLEKIIKQRKPDAILFLIAGMKFSFEMIKSYYKGLLLVYDVDGPGWSCYKDLSWLKFVDFLLTGSRVSQRDLKDQGFESFYWPGGINPEHYKQIDFDNDTKAKFGSAVSFVGRPSPRRVEFLSEIADCGLKLWGRRWSQKDECGNPDLQKCNSCNHDIFEEDVVKVYNCSDLYINILREPLNKRPTILSIQSYAVPSCGTCLIQEWVEELDEAFEDGKEIVSFKTKPEFAESVRKYSKDKDAARKIGEAGKNRVLKCHTNEHRVHELINLLTK